MEDKRDYVMRARAVAVEETRRRILGAVRDLALERESVEIVLADVADRAGVTVRTVLRQFGSREGLFAAALEAVVGEVERDRGTPGDVGGAVAALVEEYEGVGDWMITMLGREGADSTVRRMTDRGRAMHRDWVRDVFAPVLPGDRPADEVVDLLVVATDLYTWKLLRRDRGLGRAEVEQRMRALVDAVLARS
jgi:AcrR family transcriptional regulator